jgi:four helix bundle protein
MSRFKTWLAFKKAYQLSLDIYELSKSFPKDEVYALTDQVRRSSRSVCANLAEAGGKRKYRQHFLLKLTDALAENNETTYWLDFAKDAKYIETDTHQRLARTAIEVGNLLGNMIHFPEKFMHQDLSD